MAKYLNSTGVTTMWNKIKTLLASKISFKTVTSASAASSEPKDGSVIPFSTGDGSVLLPYNKSGITGFSLPLLFGTRNDSSNIVIWPSNAGITKNTNTGKIIFGWGDGSQVLATENDLVNKMTVVRDVSTSGLTSGQILLKIPGDDVYISTFNGTARKVVFDDDITSFVKVWSGTTSEYNAITTKDPNTLYIIT